MGLNSSNRKNSNFGSNKRPLVGKEKGKGKKVNWIASCTRSGCVGCGGKDGSSNHLGRSGELLVLVIGDEALPSAIGHTVTGGKNEWLPGAQEGTFGVGGGRET